MATHHRTVRGGSAPRLSARFAFFVASAMIAFLIVPFRASLSSNITSPDAFTEDSKLTAGDASGLDQFGFSVAVSGDYAIVGSPRDDDSRGSAYIFQRVGGTWVPQQKLAAGDAASEDNFGWSVAISGSTAVVGAYLDDVGGTDQGSAYVFTRSGTTWTQQQKLTAGDGAASDQFGISVAVSGDTVVAGAFGDDAFRGSAYVFTRTGTTWSQQQKLTGSDGASNDDFGWSVAISGDSAIVGSPRDDASRGSAFVFARSGTTWSEQQKLTAGDGDTLDQFGFSVSISGDSAVVGAVDDVEAGSLRGSAYVFVRTGSAWSQQQKLAASDGAANDHFGTSVGISGDRVIVGADGKDTGAAPDTGAAYIFVRSGGAWAGQQKLTASDAGAGDGFGASVAIDGSNAVVGSPLDDAAAADSGSAYAFSDGAVAPTPTPTATVAPTPTATATVAPTPTATATVAPTPTATATVVPTPTATATVAPTPTATATVAPTPTATATVAPSPTATATVAPTPTATATVVPTPTATATVAPTPTATATVTPSPTPSPTPGPASIIVTNTNDSGEGSLRRAIADAAPNGTVTFSSLFDAPQTITLTSGELVINKSITISHYDASLVTVNGNNQSRVFNISGANEVIISGITITGGNGTTGGGIANLSSGVLTVTRSVIAGNRAAQGGGIYSASRMVLSNSTVADNTAARGGGIFGEVGDLTVSNSTISGNSATASGTGGGVAITEARLAIVNSTISGNSAANGDFNAGGIGFEAGNSPGQVLNSTIANNSAAGSSSAGGIYISSPRIVRLGSTIVAGNAGATNAPDLGAAPGAAFISDGYNLIGNAGSIVVASTADQAGSPSAPLNPRLAPLALNGGLTRTHELLAGSPAIDGGNSFGLVNDQRGLGFLRVVDLGNANAAGGDGADIGAFELQAEPLVTITGRVLRPTGQAISNARVTLIKPDGTRLIATTSSFGVFSFSGLPAGSSYIITVASKRYRFAPRTITPTDDMLGLELVGLE